MNLNGVQGLGVNSLKYGALDELKRAASPEGQVASEAPIPKMITAILMALSGAEKGMELLTDRLSPISAASNCGECSDAKPPCSMPSETEQRLMLVLEAVDRLNNSIKNTRDELRI